jgi:hypothetical protein
MEPVSGEESGSPRTKTRHRALTYPCGTAILYIKSGGWIAYLLRQAGGKERPAVYLYEKQDAWVMWLPTWDAAACRIPKASDGTVVSAGAFLFGFDKIPATGKSE